MNCSPAINKCVVLPGIDKLTMVSYLRFSLLLVVVIFTELASAQELDNLQVRVVVDSRLQTTLASQIPARIQQMPMDEGDRFQQGQLLVAMDCEILLAEQQKAVMELEAAQETYTANIRMGEFATSKVEVAISAANVKRAEAQSHVMAAKVRMCNIFATFAGRVVKRQANAYQHVSEGDPLLEILDDKNLRLRLFTPSNWLRWLRPRAKFLVTIDETGQQYSAHITTFGARVDPASQTIEILAAFDSNSGELLAGMSGTAQFTRTDP